ncbi:MAG: iron-containing alcohol dehydrogenase [Candidatus Nezhaarchaeales archaeon]
MNSRYHLESHTIEMPKVIIGMHAIEKLRNVVTCFGRRALIVTGRSAMESGRVKIIEDKLKEADVDYVIYSNVNPEPTVSQAEELAKYINKIVEGPNKIDLVIGFGGGSSLDMAKVASLASANPKPIRQYIGVEKVSRKGIPLILVPTTAGSGSEVSKSIVLAIEKEEIKDAIVSENVMADVAMVDPYLTTTMNPKLTAITGIDALSHAIEAYMSLSANGFTDPLALKAISLVSTNLRKAYSNGSDIEARRAMSEAAMLAGLAFSNAGNCAGHAAAYAFAVKYKVPHGMACGISLPYVMKFNMLAIPERLADVAVAMGIRSEGLSMRELAQLAVAEVIDLLMDLDLPTTLEEVGVPEEDVVKLSEKMLKITRLIELNPRRIGPEEARKIFKIMWHGDVETKI